MFGARGVGKSWLLEATLTERTGLWINLLRDKEFLRYSSDPGLLAAEVERSFSAERPWVVIDEVQRVPALLNEVHALLEDRRFRGRLLFALSGSSARKLKRSGANLLGGRALVNQLYPLTAAEIGEAFNLEQVLAWGSLPAIVDESDPRVRAESLESYVATYLRQEIREEQIVRNLDPFSRFLEVAAQASGKIINYSAIGRDAATDSRAVARYFQILEDTLLGFILPPYHRSVRKQQGQSPKFYFFDLGVLRALQGNLAAPIVPRSSSYGQLFEHFVILEMLRLNAYYRTGHKFSYLITKDGAEIDLIIERRQQPTILLEIKSGDTPAAVDARHVARFKEDFRDAEAWLVSQQARARTEGGVQFLSWQEALKLLYPTRKD